MWEDPNPDRPLMPNRTIPKAEIRACPSFGTYYPSRFFFSFRALLCQKFCAPFLYPPTAAWTITISVSICIPGQRPAKHFSVSGVKNEVWGNKEHAWLQHALALLAVILILQPSIRFVKQHALLLFEKPTAAWTITIFVPICIPGQRPAKHFSVSWCGPSWKQLLPPVLGGGLVQVR